MLDLLACFETSISSAVSSPENRLISRMPLDREALGVLGLPGVACVGADGGGADEVEATADANALDDTLDPSIMWFNALSTIVSFPS